MAKKHTGKLAHEDMGSLIKTKKGKDKHAHHTYHEMNRKHGMSRGMLAPEETVSTTKESLSHDADCTGSQSDME